MNVSIISIGDEVLTGSTINTNAAYISQRLGRLGYKVIEHRVLPDDKSLMKKGISESLERFPIVILTGGLGPTCDDFTREVMAEIAGSALVKDEKIYQTLQERYGDRLISIENQSLVLEKAEILPNPIGTASGFKIQIGSHFLFALPGVPLELHQMLEEVILHLNKTEQQTKNFTHLIHLFNLPESAVDPFLRKLEEEFPAVKIGIYASFGILSVKFETTASHEQEAIDTLKPLIKTIEDQFQDHIFNSSRGKIEEAVQELFIQKGYTLSLAESCTGGSIASRLTKLPDCSRYFLGSLVVYSNALKQNLLGVSAKTLQNYGSVSQEVVEEMVLGLQKLTDSTYCLAVSGIAGPGGGSKDKPVGTIWGALLKKGERPFAWKFQGFGSREMIIERAVNRLLAQLIIDARET